MEELDKIIMSVLVKKKIIMERYLKKPLLYTDKIYSIIQEFDDKKQSFLIDCDKIGFENSLIKHVDFIETSFHDVINYYNTEIENCGVHEIVLYLLSEKNILLDAGKKLKNILVNSNK